MTEQATTPDLLYDHVLDEIESGREAAALLLLAGMLDAATTNPEISQQWHRVLLQHPLYQFVRSRSLRDSALAQFGFARGLAARTELGRKAIESAWKRGRKILLLQCGDDGELASLLSHETGNITIETGDVVQAESSYDLILASTIADHLSQDQLGTLIRQTGGRLNAGGALVLSSFVPCHIGRELRQICTGQTLHCHDEASLAEAASAAGFGFSSFRDASNSLIWAELRVAQRSASAQGDRT